MKKIIPSLLALVGILGAITVVNLFPPVEEAHAQRRRMTNQYPSGTDQHFIGGIELEGSKGIAINSSVSTAMLYGKQFADESAITIIDNDSSANFKLHIKGSTTQFTCSDNMWLISGTDKSIELRPGTGDLVLADGSAYPYDSRMKFDLVETPATGRILINEDSEKTYTCGASYDAKWGYDGSNLVFTLLSGTVDIPALGLLEKSADPAEPAEGKTVIWMSDGTGKGDDGDVLIAGRVGGATKWTILFDHSAGTNW